MKSIKWLLTSCIIMSMVLIFSGCPDGTGGEEGGKLDPLSGKLLILQAYGNGASNNSPAGVSHSFVELYNNTDVAINLDGISLYFANGTNEPNNTATEDEAWTKISLDGKTIPSKGSFLVLGAKHANTGSTRYKIDDDYGDIDATGMSLSRRAFKIALIRSSAALAVQNPFSSKTAGYIDMVGAANAYSTNGDNEDRINGFETAPARNSASEAVRRQNLDDTNNNSVDFIGTRYGTGTSNGIVSLTNEELAVRRPRNSTETASGWNPFDTPLPPPPPTEGLMIFQVYGIGTTTGDNTASTHSFIELYNNSEDAMNLGTFSVHYADGTTSGKTEVDSWTKINLTGSIPSKGSYLILGMQMREASEVTGAVGALSFIGVTPDLNEPTFTLSNRSWKVALMSNQNVLTEPDPWGKELGCLDIVSSINTVGTDTIDAAKGAVDLTAVNNASSGNNRISKQKSMRRISLTVTNVTLDDFTTKQYSSLSTADIAKFRPRTASNGKYTPEF